MSIINMQENSLDIDGY